MSWRMQHMRLLASSKRDTLLPRAHLHGCLHPATQYLFSAEPAHAPQSAGAAAGTRVTACRRQARACTPSAPPHTSARAGTQLHNRGLESSAQHLHMMLCQASKYGLDGHALHALGSLDSKARSAPQNKLSKRGTRCREQPAPCRSASHTFTELSLIYRIKPHLQNKSLNP